jgi:hypothetical protein
MSGAIRARTRGIVAKKAKIPPKQGIDDFAAGRIIKGEMTNDPIFLGRSWRWHRSDSDGAAAWRW